MEDHCTVKGEGDFRTYPRSSVEAAFLTSDNAEPAFNLIRKVFLYHKQVVVLSPLDLLFGNDKVNKLDIAEPATRMQFSGVFILFLR